MEAALENGELVYSVVRELTRVVVPETAPDWMAAAQGKTLREVEDMVSGREPGDGPDAPAKPELILHVLRHEITGETYANFRELAKVLHDEVGEHLDDDSLIAMLVKRALEKTAKSRPTTVTLVEGRALQDGAGKVVELSRETREQIDCQADRQDANGERLQGANLHTASSRITSNRSPKAAATTSTISSRSVGTIIARTTSASCKSSSRTVQ